MQTNGSCRRMLNNAFHTRERYAVVSAALQPSYHTIRTNAVERALTTALKERALTRPR